jgi:NAD kinase
MKIFAQEKKDDLEDLILTTPLVIIASQVVPIDDKSSKFFNKNLKSLASYDDEDLYYVQSILVTSSWNKNDDIFTKEEVWTAKNTPEDKPTNLEHDENTIIGHIVSNWSITDDGILIDEDTPSENLPDRFHIVTGSVIYKSYTNPELKERTAKLINEIENGTKYVSMECMFKGFDYGLINESTGEYKILPRSDDTSFLTKHLRAYGGSGEYDSHKVGRVLRNITFSGKGYVDKPANPDSIIFSKDNFFTISNIKNINKNFSGVSENRPNPMEANNMSLEKEVAELKDKVEAMTDCASATKEAYAQLIEIKERVVALETELQNKNQELDQSKLAFEEFVLQTEAAKKMSEEEMMKKKEEMKKAKSDLDAALEVVASYKDKEEEMTKKEKKMKRMAALLEKGLDQEVASSAVDQFESLEDSAFEAMVSLVASAAKKVMVDEKLKKTKSTEEQNVEEALDSAEPNSEIDLSAGGDATVVEDTVNTTRAELVDFVCARLGKKLNKGE